MANEEFADKVISALQKSQKAVDLSVQAVPEVAPEVQAKSDIVAFGGQVIPEFDGPTTGGLPSRSPSIVVTESPKDFGQT